MLIEDAAAWYDCTVEQRIRSGDHDIVMMCVHDMDAAGVPPPVFHASRFYRLP